MIYFILARALLVTLHSGILQHCYLVLIQSVEKAMSIPRWLARME